MIHYAIPTVMRLFLTFFTHSLGLLHRGQVFIETKSHTSFSISMDLVMPNHTGSLANLVSFFCLACTPLLFDSSAITRIQWLFFKVSGVFGVGKSSKFNQSLSGAMEVECFCLFRGF